MGGFLAISSLREKKVGLHKVFTFEWHNNFNALRVGQEVERSVLDSGFWDRLQSVFSKYKPMYTVLKLVDNEVHPTMGIVYFLIEFMIEKLKQRRGTKWVIDIVNE